jgi:hypothetical protein
MKPIDRFNQVKERCANLLALFEALEQLRAKGGKLPATKEMQCDLIRASVVLGVSGMDAYFTEKFATLLIPYLKKKGTNDKLTALLAKAGLDTKAALEIISLDRPYRRVRKLADDYLSKYTAQQLWAIDNLFDAYGVLHISRKAAATVPQKTLLKKIQSLVARRHDIVHDADVNSNGKLKPIDPKSIEKALHYLDLFIQASEKYLAKTI